MASVTDRMKYLEGNAPILFLVGGTLYAVLVINRILSTYTGTSFSQASTFAFVGEILVVLGLLGLYPALVKQRPYLSRVGAGVAVIAALASSLASIGELSKAAGIISEAPGPLGVTPFVAIIGVNLAFLLFGTAVLLGDVHPRVVGVLLILDTILFPLWLTVLSGVPAFIGNLVTLVVYLGVGVTLWVADGSPTPKTSSAEPTA